MKSHNLLFEINPYGTKKKSLRILPIFLNKQIEIYVNEGHVYYAHETSELYEQF